MAPSTGSAAPGRLGRHAVTALIVLLVGIGPLAHAHAFRTANPVVMGGDRGYPPYQFVDADGRATGFDVELFRAIGAKAGFPVKVELGNWGHARKALGDGSIDVVPMLMTPERRRQYLFSTPYLRRYHMVFGHRDADSVKSLQALAGHSVAVQYEGAAWEALKAMHGVTIVPTRFEPAAIEAVREHHAEYALVPMNIGYTVLARDEDDEVVALSPPLLEMSYAFAVRRDRPELVQRINRALADVKEDGSFDTLYMAWLANLKPGKPEFRRGLTIGGLVILPLLAFAIVILLRLRHTRRQAAGHSDRALQEARRRQELEQRAEYLAFNDEETGLHNRNGFGRDLQRIVENARRDRTRCAVIRIDLLDLSMLHAAAGGEMESRLLHAIAQRLARHAGWCPASIERGRFALALGRVADAAAATRTAAALVETVHGRLDIDKLSIEQRCCAGIALFPDHADSATALLRAADMACDAARDRQAATVVYDPGLEPDPRKLTLLGELHDAMRKRQLGCLAQPQIALATSRLAGVELLARWDHPDHGLLQPDDFIPIAEQAGTIGELTEYMVHQALAHRPVWERLGRQCKVSVNLSVNDLDDDGLIQSILAAATNAPFTLVLEITESQALREGPHVLRAIKRVKAKGMQISLDDFGTGYSSLSHLRRLAPDEVKIDQSFVRAVLESEVDRTIVISAIKLAHSLGARVCAEGVEDPGVLEWLRRNHCDLAQGYAIAPPMPVEDVADWHFETDKQTD